MSTQKVPFVDLQAGIAPHREEFLAGIAQVIDTGYFVGGPVVDAFERAFAEMCGTRYAIAVSTGTSALEVGLRALGIEPGDEVITAPNSFFATAAAITNVGAIPVFADVRDDTLNLDAEAAATQITDKTRAIVPVHLFGQMADMDAFNTLAETREVLLLEDSAQAHGATRGPRTAGSLGHAAAFSFYPTKNLGAFGEGGAITTESERVARRAKQLRDHGQLEKNDHQVVGYNARLAAMQCACLSVRLKYLPEATAGRRRAAAHYRELLADVEGVRLVHDDPAGDPVYHLYVVRVDAGERDRVRSALGASGVSTAIHYPTPIHLQRAYQHLGHRAGAFPVAERAAAEMISLPMYPEMTAAQVEYVVESLRRALAG